MIPKPLRILLIGDTRPGHEKQSLAMAEAFSGLIPAEMRWFRIPQGRSFAFLSFLDAAFAYLSPGFSGKILKRYRKEHGDFIPDLVISTGTHTQGVLLFLGRKFGAKTLVCMTPGLLVRSLADLVISPMHDGLKQKGNILVTLGPPCRQVPQGKRQKGQGLILVGGIDAESHYWQNDKLVEQAEHLLGKEDIVNWQISSSPRTPKETDDSLKALAEKFSNATFLPFSETERGWVEKAYASSEEVWITADSISMVYEALTAGCRVGVLPVLWKKERNKFKKSLDFLHSAGWIRYPDETLSDKSLPAFDEAGRAAKEALRQWWGKN